MRRQRETIESVINAHQRLTRAKNNKLPQAHIDALEADHAKRRTRLLQQRSAAPSPYHVLRADRRAEEASIRGTA